VVDDSEIRDDEGGRGNDGLRVCGHVASQATVKADDIMSLALRPAYLSTFISCAI
jgi:hypothetical protein